MPDRGKPVSQPLYDLAKKFQTDIKPPFDMSSVIKELGDWIQSHRDVLLLAWFAQYGFEPGKAILVQKNDIGETLFFIREATPGEREEARLMREKHIKEHS